VLQAKLEHLITDAVKLSFSVDLLFFVDPGMGKTEIIAHKTSTIVTVEMYLMQKKFTPHINQVFYHISSRFCC